MNDTDSGITYAGDWSYVSGRGLGDYNDDVHLAMNNFSYVQYTFKGTGVEYITEKSSDQGNVQVIVDGVAQIISCYNTTRLAQQTVFRMGWATAGSHSITLRKIDGQFMLLDAIKIYP